MALWKNKGEGEMAEQKPEPTRVPSYAPPAGPSGSGERRHPGGIEMANIGKSISIKGDVVGEEDTILEGRVEGRVSLRNHHLTIGPNGDVQGEVSAKQVTIVGKVSGNVVASERIEVRETGRIQGDLIAPRLTVAEGAIINGAITMKEAGALGQVRPAEKKPDLAHGSAPASAPAPSIQKVG
jgi:cytoskeletal protein CcmA (bactofilin family)